LSGKREGEPSAEPAFGDIPKPGANSSRLLSFQRTNKPLDSNEKNHHIPKTNMTTTHRPLTEQELATLTSQGCQCDDWSAVQVADGFLAERVRHATFSGEIRLGRNEGSVRCEGGVERRCGIDHAHLHNVTLGDNVRVANIGVHLANYDVGSGTTIENVGLLETRPGACFGNGVEIEPLNEGGGREVILFNRLDSQFAHLLCLHRYRTGLTDALVAMAKAEAAKVVSDRGTIGRGARLMNVKSIIDVCLGDAVIVDGAASLLDGTVLSSPDAPTLIGTDVQAENFIIAEGSKVTGGAMVSKSFVGQGCQIGRQFSSEGSVFFANCEGFHGEACSVFAGPYTVTHHKSTLLIAGYFSFYNAGSGTNQSNHLYKLGPVHEGKLERGCKTGSFSYMMWPCRVGPFSVVLGKHTRTFDTSDFPFSYIEASPEGRCMLTPGFNFTTVGTVRDGAKWPARDRRQGDVRRDRLCFDVLSPLTVGRMIRGSERMKELQEKTDRAVETVTIGGAEMKRVMLRSAQKTYRTAINLYLLEQVVARLEDAGQKGGASPAEALAVSPKAVLDEQWVDIGGQLLPKARLDALCEAVEKEGANGFDTLCRLLDEAFDHYAEDQWAWVCWAYERVHGEQLAALDQPALVKLVDDWAKTKEKFLKLVLLDAGKEFDPVVQTGFGQDGTGEDAGADFSAVRGTLEGNSFVNKVNDEIAGVAGHAEAIKKLL